MSINVTSKVQVNKSVNNPLRKEKTPRNENQTQQNFFGYIPQESKGQKQVPILGNQDLNAMLFKVKKYYNELNKMKIEKKKAVDKLKEISACNTGKIEQLENFQDIEFQNENISIKNITNLKENKEEIKRHIENLIDEKKQLDEKYTNELEYSNTLTHMINSEKQILETLNATLVSTQEKIVAIKYTRKNFEANIKEENRKLKVYRGVMKNLEDEMVNLEELMKYQTSGIESITGNLGNDEKGVERLRKALEEKNILLEKEVQKEKENILNKIKETEELKKQKIKRESEYIKMTLGMDIIKKYYIDVNKRGEEINNTILLNSEDHKVFKAEKYNIYDDEMGGFILNTNNLSYMKEDTKIIDKFELNPFMRQSTTLSTTNHFHTSGRFTLTSMKTIASPHKSSKIARISLRELKQKLDDLDFEDEDLEDFYNKIINKTAFYQSTMNMLNSKIINLEFRKETNSRRVKEIMQHGYKNFEDLIKTNSRFNNFMEGYQREMRLKREKELADFITVALSEHFTKNSDFPPQVYNDFYEKTDKLISVLKLYLEFILFSFGMMMEECEGQIEVKHIYDAVKAVHKMCKDFYLNNWVALAKSPKIQYFTDILDYGVKNEHVNRILREKCGIEAQKVVDFFKCNPYSKFIYEVGIPMEKSIFYFFLKIDLTAETNVKFFQCVDMCHQAYKLGVYRKMTSDKTTGYKFKKGKFSNVSTYDFLAKILASTTVFNNLFPELRTISYEYEEDSYFSEHENEDTITNEKEKKSGATGFATSRSQATARLKKPKRPPTTTLSSFPDYLSNINEKLAPSHAAISPTGKNSSFFHSYDQKIADKLYNPFMEKRNYNTKLNENIAQIKKNTRKSAMLTHFLGKKKKEIDKISDELIIYKNPSINLDSLSNNTYNNFVKYIISHQYEIKNFREAVELGIPQLKHKQSKKNLNNNPALVASKSVKSAKTSSLKVTMG